MAKKISTKQLTVTAIMLAVTVALQFASTILPIADLTVMAVCGAILYIVNVYIGGMPARLLFVAASLLSVLIIPNKFAILPYVFGFAPYALLKDPIENFFRKPAEEKMTRRAVVFAYIVKEIAVTILMAAAFLIFGSAFYDLKNLPEIPAVIPLSIVAVIVFILIYDRILTLVSIIVQRYAERWR